MVEQSRAVVYYECAEVHLWNPFATYVKERLSPSTKKTVKGRGGHGTPGTPSSKWPALYCMLGWLVQLQVCVHVRTRARPRTLALCDSY